MEPGQESTFIPVLGSLGVLEVVTERWPEAESPYVLQLFFAETSKGKECVGVFLGSFETLEGHGISPDEGVQPVAGAVARVSTSDLRRVSLKRRTQEEISRAQGVKPWELTDVELERTIARFSTKYPGQKIPTIAEVLVEMAPEDLQEVLGRRQPVRTERRRGKGGRPPLAVDHYEDIARLYDEEVNGGNKKPAKAIAARYGKSIRTARNWIWEARRKGLLPGTKPGLIQPNPEEET